MNDYIVFIDSGLGGASIAKSFYNLYKYNTLLVIDNKNAPLGNKSQEFLLSNLIDVILQIRSRYKIRAVVLACNTLSVNCFDKITKIFDIKFFKITPNLEVPKESLLLCTNATASMLILPDNVKVLPMENLATLIDKYYFNKPQLIDDYLSKCLHGFKEYDSIILGCTHYSLVKDNIKNIIGYDIKFYDNKDGLIKSVSRILPTRRISKPDFKLVMTKNNRNFGEKIKKYFQLD